MTTEASATGVTTPTWEQLSSIADRYGPSFYLAEPARFEENCRRFLEAFRSSYPRTSIGYSYKTNYLPAFIRRAHDLGAFSEVVSRFEFDIARKLGIPGERIIFNGPVKGFDDLLVAFEANALVNADSVQELWEMTAVADRLRAPAALGVRCDLRSHTVDSRFGVDLTATDTAEALRAIDGTANLRLAGLHFHHSGDRSAEQYHHRTKAMIELHRETLGGRPLDFVDMGGGFAGTMSPELARQLDSSSATFEDYADAVAGEMRAAYGATGPELILEPGMGLLADTMVFVTRVETVKVQHRRLAVVDGSGLNVQPPWNLLRRGINLPMRVVADPGNTAAGEGPWDVVGHTCIEGDLLHEQFSGALGLGDYVLFDNVGAYTNVLNAPFIRGTPPIVSISAEGSVDLLRAGSTAHDLMRSYGVDGNDR